MKRVLQRLAPIGTKFAFPTKGMKAADQQLTAIAIAIGNPVIMFTTQTRLRTRGGRFSEPKLRSQNVQPTLMTMPACMVGFSEAVISAPEGIVGSIHRSARRVKNKLLKQNMQTANIQPASLTHLHFIVPCHLPTANSHEPQTTTRSLLRPRCSQQRRSRKQSRASRLREIRRHLRFALRLLQKCLNQRLQIGPGYLSARVQISWHFKKDDAVYACHRH